MGKISNVTNSSDPSLVNSRLFVGNLNTFVITKEDVENIFKRYGKIIGISMHKGFAFVQYTTELEARNAVQGEDQRVYATQPIDVNLSAEPKPNRPSRKRPPGAGAEWDYFYNLPVARMPGTAPTPIKRPCPDLSAMLINQLNPLATVTATPILRPQPTLVPLPGAISNPVISTPARKVVVSRHKPLYTSSYKSTPSPSLQYSYIQSPRTTTPQHLQLNGNSSTTSTDATEDILICGSCRQIYKSLPELTEHKKYKCSIPCNCASRKSISKEPSLFTCATCHIDFESCWTLCQHCQSEHGIQIFVDTKNKESVVNSNPNDGDTVGNIAITASENQLEIPQMLNSYDKLETAAIVNGI